MGRFKIRRSGFILTRIILWRRFPNEDVVNYVTEIDPGKITDSLLISIKRLRKFVDEIFDSKKTIPINSDCNQAHELTRKKIITIVYIKHLI